MVRRNIRVRWVRARLAMKFDVVIIGGGHAGAEAASAAARLGCRTALITLDASRIGVMSCNPAIGGLAKGQLVKEIDALGGLMGINTDRTAIQYRRLNASKGPAVRSSRAQCDKRLYAETLQRELAGIENLSIISGEIAEIRLSGGKTASVRLVSGDEIACDSVVVTTGTFLRGLLYTGFVRCEGGRIDERAAQSLSANLEGMGFQLRRLKTGTPPRLNKKSINFNGLEPQPGDSNPRPFSFYAKPERFPILPQVNCHITYTNTKTHEIIEENLGRSPMFSGMIRGVGPRYCPAIEDKVKRFRGRERHQVFLEPEGLDSDDIYANGISTSLPQDVQEQFVRSIAGLERAEFVRYGYAVEYDCIDPRQLRGTLESKDIPGLFFAGQVNGTSGYEEAAAQGLVAGVNAALKIRGQEPFILSRDEAYIGVLIDDLVTKGADEPYRMFTSRAEFRLLLREDNADLRLSDRGWNIGLLGKEAHSSFCKRRESIERRKRELAEHFFVPGGPAGAWVEAQGLGVLKDRVSAEIFLRRPEVNWQVLCTLGFPGVDCQEEVSEQVEIQTKYEGYIKRELELLEGVRKSERVRIPAGLRYDDIPGLSNEVKGRLREARPETIGQASRMPGITPAAIANLLIYLKMEGRTRAGADV